MIRVGSEFSGVGAFNQALCQWQVNQFTKLGTHIYCHFVIQKI